jgi:membrane-associated phospholipid phosphatase
VLVFAAILVPPFFGQRLASRRYIVAVVTATIFTSVLFALWPACGPWTTESLRPTAEQAAVTARLLALKSSAPAVLDLQHTAIVSFPSFHVILAVLSAIALHRVPRVRRWACALAALTSLSTITTGWHYGFDLLGGLAVTAAAWSIARLAVLPDAALRPHQISDSTAEPVRDLAA